MTVFNGSAKDYAASLGLCKSGRGRMNAAAMDAVAKARADGMTFSKESVTVSNHEPKSQSESPKISGKDLRPGAPMTSESGTVWTGSLNGKMIKDIPGSVCCTRCQVSLAYHTCNTPTAVVYDGTIIPVRVQ